MAITAARTSSETLGSSLQLRNPRRPAMAFAALRASASGSRVQRIRPTAPCRRPPLDSYQRCGPARTTASCNLSRSIRMWFAPVVGGSGTAQERTCIPGLRRLALHSALGEACKFRPGNGWVAGPGVLREICHFATNLLIRKGHKGDSNYKDFYIPERRPSSSHRPAPSTPVGSLHMLGITGLSDPCPRISL